MGVFHKLFDGLANLMTGAGTTADRRTYGAYHFLALDPAQAEAAYRTSWLVRKIIDLPAEDMTRAERRWQADKQQIEALEAEEDRLQLWPKLQRALVLSRLQGGGALYLGTGESDPSQPMRPVTTKGGLRFVHVFSRKELSHGDKRRDPEDPWFGHPEYFEITTGAAGRTGLTQRIHPSRMVCLVGQRAPEGSYLGGASWFWGDPVMQSIEDAVKNADSAQNGFASLIDQASIDVLKVPRLMEMAASTDYAAQFQRRVDAMALGKSTHRMVVVDMEEEWAQRQTAWAGIPEIIHTYLNIVAGAADIPVTRLLGQSPKGLQSTGSGEERDYKDMIAAKQGQQLRPALDRIDEALIPSALGSRPPEIYYEFGSLMQLDPKQAAEIEKLIADVVDVLARTGLVPNEALAEAVINRMVESGQWPGLDDAVDAVKEALKLDPVDPAQEPDPSQMQATPEPVPLRRAANDAAAWLTDATPRPLYVQRKLLNAADLIAWAKANGIETTLPAADMHVTVLYSRAPVDPMKMGRSWSEDEKGQLTVRPGGPRVIERLGENAVVLRFACPDLEWRHRDMIEAGGSHDYAEYAPHVTISYGVPAGADLDALKPFNGELRFGPEIFEALDLDWKSKVVEA